MPFQVQNSGLFWKQSWCHQCEASVYFSFKRGKRINSPLVLSGDSPWIQTGSRLFQEDVFANELSHAQQRQYCLPSLLVFELLMTGLSDLPNLNDSIILHPHQAHAASRVDLVGTTMVIQMRELQTAFRKMGRREESQKYSKCDEKFLQRTDEVSLFPIRSHWLLHDKLFQLSPSNQIFQPPLSFWVSKYSWNSKDHQQAIRDEPLW